MRKLLLFLLFVLAVLTVCALIPRQTPEPVPTPTLAATITPVVIERATQTRAVTEAPTSTELPPESTPATPAATAATNSTSTEAPIPTFVPSPTVSPAPLTIQLDAPHYIPAFPHAHLGCDWAGVAGQILAENGEGINGAVVVVSGLANGQKVEDIALAGSSPVYGPGGYEIDLSAYRGLGASAAQIRVHDLNGESLSDVISFKLPETCGENLALITFHSTHSTSTTNEIYLPVIN